MSSDMPHEKMFFLKDGRAFHNVKDLAKAVEEMPKEEFMGHVNAEKNDFYNWIKEVVGNNKLATSIKNIKTQKTMAKKMRGR